MNIGNNVTSNIKKTNTFNKNVFVIPLATMMTIVPWLENLKASNVETLFSNLEWKNVTVWHINDNILSKEEIAMKYLEHNLFVKWKPITHEEYKHKIKNLWNDVYEIKYSHPFEWIPNFSIPSNREVTIKVNVTYKNNNIYIKFNEVKIWEHILSENWTLIVNNTVYDYDISEWINKAINLNSGPNTYKTTERIIKEIQKMTFSFNPKMKEIPMFENTQLTKLNDISLWKEVFKDGEFYYRTIFLIEKWQYRPIWKLYFDNKGNISKETLDKTNKEIKDKEILVLWVNLNFIEIEFKNNNLETGLKEISKKELEENVDNHRKTIISVIDKAKIWDNSEFKWFNKILSTRIWRQDGVAERLFDTKLITLELIDDTYVFQRWDKTQSISFWLEELSWWEHNIYLKNPNWEKTTSYFITIKNKNYEFVLQNNELRIRERKKAWTNIENNLPKFSWDKNIVNILEDKNINHYYNKSLKQLEYWTNEGIMVTSIPCEKTEKWEYKLNKSSTNINIEDLYNSPEFKDIVDNIKKSQKKLNTLDIDMLNSFKSMLEKEWVKLDNQNLIRVVDKKGNAHYCKTKQTKNWINISLDEKLYKDVKSILRQIQFKIDIIEKLSNAKLIYNDNGSEKDFTSFVWWWWGIWTKFISQENIVSILSSNSNEVNLEILYGEGSSVTIIYWIKEKYGNVNLLLRNKWKEVYISNLLYNIAIKNNWDIIVTPKISK